MMTHYRRAMDHITLPGEARGRIQASLCRPARSPRRRTVLILAAALVLLLGGTALAGGIFYHDLPAAIVQRLTPVQRSDTDQGITMTVQSVSAEEGVFTAYITLEDIREDRLRDGADLFDSYRMGPIFREDVVSLGCEPLGFDQDSGTYGYLITIRPKDGLGRALNFTGRKFTFSIRQLMLGQTKTEAVLPMDWSRLPAVPATARRELAGRSWSDGYEPPAFSDGAALLLQPGSYDVEAAPGVTLTAAGFLDGRLRLQLHFDKAGPDDHGRLALTAPDGTKIEECASLSSREEDGGSYRESLYEITPEELAGCALSGQFRTGGYLLSGNWRVTFPLEP